MQQHVAGLGKPVEKVIADYHAAGFSAYEPSQYVMVEGMPEFVKGEIYRGMVKGFAANFGDAIDTGRRMFRPRQCTHVTAKSDSPESSS